MSNEFMVMLVNALKKRQADLYPDVKLIINDAEGRSDKQANQVETFVTQGVDSIIICPRDGDALIPSCAAAVKAGVPVITMSANLNEDVGQVWSGSEHRSAGQIQMEYVAKALGGKGNVALLLGPIGHMAQIQRLEGYNDVLAKHPEMKVVFQLNGDWARDKGMTIMENWLQSGKKIDAVVAQNDEMALGALIAIESAGLGGQINVSGIDAIPDGLNAVKDGRMNATVYQDSIGQAFGALDLAVKAAKGEEIHDNVIPFELVTIENVDEYFDKADLSKR